MKLAVIILPLITLCTACCEESGGRAERYVAANKLTQTHLMDCTKDITVSIGTIVHRCENTEAICYLSSQGIACQFKPAKP